jgi:hypothetical protein
MKIQISFHSMRINQSINPFIEIKFSNSKRISSNEIVAITDAIAICPLPSQ